MRINIPDKNIFNNKCILIFLIAFVVIFPSTYNPLNLKRMHIDSSVYMTVTNGIINGFLPYRDLVDNKGPLTYLINVPGFYLGGFTGVWLTLFVLMFVSVLFAYKTALFFGSRFAALLGTAFCFVLINLPHSISAEVEEFSMPFLMISIYIITKYYFSTERNISFYELIILGFCFSSAVMIRINMFPLWAGFCLIIFIESIIKRRFVQLLKYIAGFCTGIGIVFIPVFIYLGANGITGDFIEQVILGGTARGFIYTNINEISKSFFIVFNRDYTFFPLFFTFYYCIKKYRTDVFYYYLGFGLSFILMALSLSFLDNTPHHNIVFMPLFLVSLTVLIHKFDTSYLKNRKIMLVLFLCLIFSEGILKYFYNVPKIFNDNSGTLLVNAGKIIDENTNPGDTIISLGIQGYIYPFTQRHSASRYFYQGAGVNFIPGARENFINDILTGKPKIIAFFTEDRGSDYMQDWHAAIFEMIGREYRILSNENNFELFIRD